MSGFWYVFISLRQSSTDHIHTAAIFPLRSSSGWET